MPKLLPYEFSFLFVFSFSVETVNDGQFHSVELVMLNQTLNLVVDKGAPKSLGKLQKQPVVGYNTPLYIGGKFSCSQNYSLNYITLSLPISVLLQAQFWDRDLYRDSAALLVVLNLFTAFSIL